MTLVPLRYLSMVPITNGLGLSGANDNPEWPRYIRTTDIAGPTTLREDVFASQPPEVAAAAMVAPGDILMTAAGASIGKSVTFSEPYPACYAGFLVRVRPRNATSGRFLGYWMQSRHYWSQVESGAVKSTIENFSAGRYRSLLVPQPAIDDQAEIAGFLDRETTKIDALVGEQEGLVRVLRERRSAVIEEILRSAIPATDGQRLKHLVVGTTQGWSPQCYSWPADGIETWGVLKAGAANGGTFKPMENKELPPTESPRPEVVVRRGHLIVSRANTRELVGSAAVVENDFPRLMLCDKLYAFDLDLKRALPHYVALTLGTRRWRDLIELEASGSSPSMQNISQADIVNLPMDLPTVEMQQVLLDELREQTRKTDALIAEAEGVVAVARERRYALITAAVTGQIDLRGEVA